MVTVSAQTNDDEAGTAGVTFEYEFGGTLEEQCNLFGKELVFSHSTRSLTIAAQSRARQLIKAGKSPEEIQADMDNWKPGAPRVVRSVEDRVRELLAKLDPEERARLAKEIKTSKTA